MKGRKQKLRLLAFRKSLNLTQSELAALLSIKQAVWSHYELGHSEPTLTQWLKMKSSADYNNIILNESLFYQEVKKEDTEVTFTTTSILRLRTHLNLSQEVIAKECGITYRTWGRYERGESELLASTYFHIRDYAREHGVELLPFIKEVVDKIDVFVQECYVKPSLRLCLQR